LLWILQFHCENSLMQRTDWPPNKNWQSNVDICCSEHSCKQKDENNMLQLYSDLCPNIFKSTKDFISQYNHIACLIRFGLLHKMKWSSRTSSTEVARWWGKSNNSISTLKHPSLFLNRLLYYPQCRMSLKSFQCWHPIVVYRLQYTSTELCHVQSTAQCQETTKAPHMVHILVYYIKNEMK
jgi:hypothetical protein